LAGLRFNKQLVQQFFREGIMRESVIYQDILREGLQQGLEQGLEQGLAQGKQQEGVALVLRQLTRRIGALASESEDRIRGLSIAQLEDLAEALLDFSQPTDLMNWLEGHPSI
jgi:predicted transposase YdaD